MRRRGGQGGLPSVRPDAAECDRTSGERLFAASPAIVRLRALGRGRLSLVFILWYRSLLSAIRHARAEGASFSDAPRNLPLDPYLLSAIEFTGFAPLSRFGHPAGGSMKPDLQMAFV